VHASLEPGTDKARCVTPAIASWPIRRNPGSQHRRTGWHLHHPAQSPHNRRFLTSCSVHHALYIGAGDASQLASVIAVRGGHDGAWLPEEEAGEQKALQCVSRGAGARGSGPGSANHEANTLKGAKQDTPE
jgi:hypothetical protein